MNTKYLSMLSVVVVVGFSAVGQAAPLPNGTLLTIDPGILSGIYGPCVSGSCFGFDWYSTPTYGTPIAPGTDGGIILGKNQKGGGQEVIETYKQVILTPGEITAAWFNNGLGTFATVPFIAGKPDASANLFSDTSCEGPACLGMTELRAWYAAWGESLGKQYLFLGTPLTCDWTICGGVTKWTVTPAGPPGPDGDHYVLEYADLATGWSCGLTAGCAHFWLRLEGTIWLPGSNAPPVAVPLVIVHARQDTTATWTPIVSDRSNDPLTCRIGTLPQNGVATVATDCSSGTYQPKRGFIGTDSFTYVSNDGVLDSSPGPVTAVVNAAFTAENVILSAISGATVSWAPQVTGVNSYDRPTCRLGTLPANGTATIASSCVGYLSGTYKFNPGFIGIDSFTYIVNNGEEDTNSGTVTVAVTETPPTDPCLAQFPATLLTQTGKQGTLSITFTGNIVSSTNKEIKICPGTTLSYTASSTKDIVKCKIKNSLTSGIGTLRIKDHLKCTDKPGGKDKVQFKVKSGVTY